MIYVYAIFFGVGSMHLLRFLWEDYTGLILGADLMAEIFASPAVSMLWTLSYVLFAVVAVVFASVPAARFRDATLAAINGALFGAVIGLALAAILWLTGEIGFLVEAAEIVAIPVGLSLVITLMGYVGVRLTRMDELSYSKAEDGTDMGAANDNGPEQDAIFSLKPPTVARAS